MDDFGELLGGLAETVGALLGFGSAGEAGSGGEPRSETATVDRVLTGERRELHVNDR